MKLFIKIPLCILLHTYCKFPVLGNKVNLIYFRLDSLQASLSIVAPLCGSLQAVREENMRHSQYATAMDSLKHIFTVPESVEKTKQWISEGKLLHAHQVYTKYTIFFKLLNH